MHRVLNANVLTPRLETWANSTSEKATIGLAKRFLHLSFTRNVADTDHSAKNESMRRHLVILILGCLATIATTTPLPNRVLRLRSGVGVFTNNPPDTPKHCCKKCRLLNRGDANVQPAPRPVFPGLPGLLRTGTTPAEAVTPSVERLNIVRTMLCTDEGEECAPVGSDVSG